MITEVAAMGVFALVGSVSPGPVNIIAATVGMKLGYRRAVSFVLGTSIAYATVVLLCGLGLDVVAQYLPQVTSYLKAVGGVFLLYMAFKIAMSAKVSNTQQAMDLRPSFSHGALAQWLNPKAWLVAMSGVSVFVINHQPVNAYILVFTLISLMLCFVGVSVWALLGDVIRRKMSNDKYHQRIHWLMACLLAGTVVMIWL
ncbi:LysE family translocator [Photobacterium nomapromontoriensis]|uniref:LysE family translocator n=1 Tax=Photobacterium nomapromontoriensis TaxID=2910237 RepID=UPI003D13C02C